MLEIKSDLAPNPIGNYSQAIRCGDTIYLSGQIPLNPKTMQLCCTEIITQINQVFDNIHAICNAAGGSLKDIVKLVIYLTNLENSSMVNNIMSRYFTPPYPARVTIGVSELPLNAQIEIEGIMVLAQQKLSK